MKSRGIDILCLQETYRVLSDVIVTDDQFLFILSGGGADTREFAGVGFLLSPNIRASLWGFC